MRLCPPRKPARRGAAVVELAIVLPIMVFLLLVGIDYCRLFFFSQIVCNCTRNGAVYVTDPYANFDSPYASLDAAAKADAPTDIQSQLTVTSTTGTDSIGSYTQVTVSYPFTTLTSYPGLPKTVTITRSAQVRVAPQVPK